MMALFVGRVVDRGLLGYLNLRGFRQRAETSVEPSTLPLFDFVGNRPFSNEAGLLANGLLC